MNIPAAELTSEQGAEICRQAGVEMEYVTAGEGHAVSLRTRCPVAIADRGDGGYLIAVLKPPAPPQESDYEAI